MTSSPLSVVVVGGSLTGLASAIRLARAGLNVIVLERSTTLGNEGAGLGVDRHQLSEVTCASAFGDGEWPVLPVIGSNRDSTTWIALYQWLTEVATRSDRITIRNGHNVVHVAAEGDKGRVFTEESSYVADLVIGADGRNSIVRRVVAPALPDARYAGYCLWRGLIEETSLPKGLLNARPHAVDVMCSGPYRLVAYETPGHDGNVKPGHRAVSWAWYDPDATPLLERTKCIEDGLVLRSMRPMEFGDELLSVLKEQARQHWADPWRTAIVASLSQKQCFATPIAEYIPVRLSLGCFALVGDAAHIVSPMMGAGLTTGLDDVAVLGELVECELAGGQSALPIYNKKRLPIAQSISQSSVRWSRNYVDSVGTPFNLQYEHVLGNMKATGSSATT
jgi:2-polyprenyl-6-methoxyphenol hydroxylase-like FAD-dependent oxidoreductase